MHAGLSGLIHDLLLHPTATRMEVPGPCHSPDSFWCKSIERLCQIAAAFLSVSQPDARAIPACLT